MLINVLNIYAKYFVDVTDIYETVSVYIMYLLTTNEFLCMWMHCNG